METVRLRWRVRRSRGGYAMLLGLLIAVVIGMILCYTRMHGPVYEIGEGESDIEPPWRQWHKMQVKLNKKKSLGLPSVEQPQLSEPLKIHAKVLQDGKKRGNISIALLDDGTVKGGWAGEFSVKKDVDFQVVNCNFKGRVDPKQLYIDDEGEDPSKLFFIAKGHFSILEFNDDSGKVRHLMGDLYVRGWLGVDNAVSGEIIFTSDERNFHRYIWEALAEEGRSFFFK